MLNHIQFIIQSCIPSSQETSKYIQELSKTNILEPPSFQASLPLSLQVPAAKRFGGIREAQTITIAKAQLQDRLCETIVAKAHLHNKYRKCHSCTTTMQNHNHKARTVLNFSF